MARGTRNKRHGKADGPAAARRRTGSPITQRILFVNVLALVLLVGGLLYLEDYRETLIDAELASLNSQAELLAAALGEGAVAAAEARPRELSATIASRIVRRMVETTGSRARLFALNGDLIADSRLLMGTAGFVQIEELPPPGTEPGLLSDALALFDRLVLYLPWFKTYPPYEERPGADAADYPEAVQALTGERGAGAVRSQRRGGLILSSAAPVQHFKQVLGAVMLSKDSSDIDAAVYDVRVAILQIFAIALAVTVLLSIYLAGTIARPLRRLAAA
ncbi:MAG: stimulus-sensing domain-containing protein, partial [Rhodobacterales bacterium]|nr:stimulus-sensing domain-containing protein [Rhodobacterales bacterium]